MAELHSTSRRSNSPCLFSSSSGSFKAAPVAGLRQFSLWPVCDRATCARPEVSAASLGGVWTRLSPAISGVIVTIESGRAPKFRVTTFIATGKLTAPAECP